MTTYPPRRGDDPSAVERWATACRASATVLRREGHPAEAGDLEAAARRANTTPLRRGRGASGDDVGTPGWW
ncbi:hypothetical protein [Phycicoccus avicenniae]|uniref:hypothetical protein n=1 Tax=Phycicoccus avicenniae TaxID=2828860 RepID=UPI003D274AC8